MKTARYILLIAAAALMTGCDGFLDRPSLTDPSSETYLSSEAQLFSYVNGLYIALPALRQYGSGVRSVEKNSDNILSEAYDKRINGEYTEFSGQTDWTAAYQNLRDVNYFFEYDRVPSELVSDDVRSLRGEVHFLRAWWHYELLRKFGGVPVMDAFWDGNATLDGLQIPASDRKEVARNILGDLEEAIGLLHERDVYKGLRINKEAALVLAMNVALFEGSWERYHMDDAFSADEPEPEWFFGKVMEYGDALFALMPVSEGLNTVENDPFGASSGGDAFAHMFNSKDYSAVPEALFWKKYDVSQGVQHSLTTLLATGVTDSEGPAGLSKSLVDSYLNADGTPIDPSDRRFKDFNLTFEGRDSRLSETVMSSGHKFRSSSMTLPLKVADCTQEDRVSPPRLHGDGNGRNITGYHTALGVDTTYVAATFWDTGLVMIRYAEALLAYAEAAEELGRCTDEVLAMTLKPLRERADVRWTAPVNDPFFTDYGYALTPVMQEIRRERRTELALQGFRLDDILRWKGHKAIAGQRGRGAYFGSDGILYRSFDSTDPLVMEVISNVIVDENGWMDPLRPKLPEGYGFRPDRDYLMPIPPEDIILNGTLKQNPNW